MLSSTVVQCSTLAARRGESISSEQLARHEGLVRWVVRRQYLGDIPFADAMAEGRIGLWHALRRYDPSRGTAFSSYAVPAIAHAVWEAVGAGRASAVPSARGGMLPAALPPESAEPFDPDGLVHASQVRAGIRALVDRLPTRLGLVIVAHYGLGDSEPRSLAAIGRTLGVTRQRVQQLHVEALLWLAHPAHSLPLRRLLEMDSRAHYQRALAYHYQRTRAPRRTGGTGP